MRRIFGRYVGAISIVIVLIFSWSCSFAENPVIKNVGSNRCVAWSGNFQGEISGSQNIMAADQTITISIGDGAMTAILYGKESPRIYIWSKDVKCADHKLIIMFDDNGGGGGQILMSYTKNYSIKFLDLKEGSSLNYLGYYPSGRINLKKLGK
jgi:hypothetical protein